MAFNAEQSSSVAEHKQSLMKPATGLDDAKGSSAVITSANSTTGSDESGTLACAKRWINCSLLDRELQSAVRLAGRSALTISSAVVARATASSASVGQQATWVSTSLAHHESTEAISPPACLRSHAVPMDSSGMRSSSPRARALASMKHARKCTKSCACHRTKAAAAVTSTSSSGR